MWQTFLCLGCLALPALGTKKLQAASLPLPQAALRSAQAELRSAIADLRSAQTSAGTAARPARGSRRKLTLLRLNSARQRLARAGKLLAGFSKSNKAAQSLRKTREGALKALRQIEGILAGGKKPTPTRTPQAGSGKNTGGNTTGNSAAKSRTARLGYKQKDLLKNVRWYLRETQKFLKPGQGILARIDGKGPKPVVSEVQQAMASTERAAAKFKLARDYLAQLPAKHPEVAPIGEKLQATGQLLGALRSRLRAETTRLTKLTGMGNYPRYQEDFALLGAFSMRYSNFELLSQQPAKLAKVITEDGKALREIQRIAKTYQSLANQKTREGRAMEKRVLYALSKRKSFILNLKSYLKELPGEIDRYIQEAMKIAREGVEKKRPLFFGKNGGIAQQLGFAKTKIQVLRALGEERAKPFVAKIKAARQKVEEAARTLTAEIIANNTLPPDRYIAKDRKQLVQRAIQALKKQREGIKVLSAKIPSSTWERVTRWDWYGKAFHKVDYSKLQVQLVVQHNEKLAAVLPINLFIDHMKGDKLKAIPFDAKDAKLQPHRFLPLSRVK